MQRGIKAWRQRQRMQSTTISTVRRGPAGPSGSRISAARSMMRNRTNKRSVAMTIAKIAMAKRGNAGRGNTTRTFRGNQYVRVGSGAITRGTIARLRLGKGRRVR